MYSRRKKELKKKAFFVSQRLLSQEAAKVQEMLGNQAAEANQQTAEQNMDMSLKCKVEIEYHFACTLAFMSRHPGGG